MDSAVWGFLGVLVGSVTSFLATRQQLNHSLKLDEERRIEEGRIAEAESRRMAEATRVAKLTEVVTRGTEAVTLARINLHWGVSDQEQFTNLLKDFAASIGEASLESTAVGRSAQDLMDAIIDEAVDPDQDIEHRGMRSELASLSRVVGDVLSGRRVEVSVRPVTIDVE